MNFLNQFAVSASGLRAQRMRLEIIAANLANATSTRTPEGGPYRRRDVVLKSAPVGGSFEEMIGGPEVGMEGVEVAAVTTDPRPPRLVFDPGHPDANAEGYVAMPNINVVAEMTDLMSATRAYEANLTVLNTTKRLREAALEIGRA